MTLGKKILIIFIVLLAMTVSSGLTVIILSFGGSEGKEPLPQKVVQSQISPDGTIKALLFYAHTGESWDILGTGERNYLGLERKGVIYIIARDLTEGFGTYEGGVLGIKWLNNDQILVERIISDRRDDIIFDLVKNEWKTLKQLE